MNRIKINVMKNFYFILLFTCLIAQQATAQWSTFTPAFDDTIGIADMHVLNDHVVMAVGQITNLQIHGKPWKGDTSIMEATWIRLHHTQNALTFELAAMEYLDPEKNQFKVRLDNYDRDWVNLGTQNFITYANLPPGKYNFQFTACNAEVIWNETPKTLHITIDPPFYQTWTFYIAVALTLLATAWYSIKTYYRRREKIRQLEAEKRIGIEQEQRRAAEFELRSLRSLINPHFFFNALNSLNAFILKNDSRKASDYLGEFASLMRKTLDNSTQQTLPLYDELAFIQSYIAVENRRFTPPFACEVSVAPGIDPYETTVPSMILQPFVENAIWHGIQHLPPGTGRLLLKVDQPNDTQIRFFLEDNGIGREKAAELRKKQGFMHRSRGMEITRDRLEKLASGNQVIFTDLKDAEGVAIGTRVEIFVDVRGV
jgi:hypothetical protein